MDVQTSQIILHIQAIDHKQMIVLGSVMHDITKMEILVQYVQRDIIVNEVTKFHVLQYEVIIQVIHELHPRMIVINE